MENVNTLINGLGEKIVHNKPFSVPSQIKMIRKSFDGIIKKMKTLPEDMTSPGMICRQITDQQMEVSTLLDRAETLLKAIDRSGTSLKFRISCKEVLWTLIRNSFSFIEFLRGRYKDYFNHNLAIPGVLYPFYFAKMTKQWRAYRSLLERYAVDIPLLSILDGVFGKWKESHPYGKIKWKDLDYLQVLCAELDWLTKNKGSSSLHEELLYHLFHINFNHKTLFAYCTDYMHKHTLNVDTLVQERREWLDFSRTVAAIIVRRDISYDNTLDSIKLQLNDYINQQIRYIKKKEKLHRPQYSGKFGRIMHPFYFRVSLTVAQLVFLFRLFVESGVIITKNSKDLNEFIVNHIGTLRKDGISPGSIRSKYTPPDKSTVDRVSTVLISMLNLLNAKYKTR